LFDFLFDPFCKLCGAKADCTLDVEARDQSSLGHLVDVLWRNTQHFFHLSHFQLLAPLPDTLQHQEKEMIEAALAECNGKVAGPEGEAANLGIPRSTLDSKIKQLKIKKHKFISEQ
jgi:DNA-binding NtrC family response regulator